MWIGCYPQGFQNELKDKRKKLLVHEHLHFMYKKYLVWTFKFMPELGRVARCLAAIPLLFFSNTISSFTQFSIRLHENIIDILSTLYAVLSFDQSFVQSLDLIKLQSVLGLDQTSSSPRTWSKLHPVLYDFDQSSSSPWTWLNIMISQF
jgi:hypothetical protein